MRNSFRYLGGDTMIKEEEKRWGFWSSASPHSKIMLISIHRLRSISKNCTSKAIHKKSFQVVGQWKKWRIFLSGTWFLFYRLPKLCAHTTRRPLNWIKLRRLIIFFFLAIFEMPCTKTKHLWKNWTLNKKKIDNDNEEF